jgi:hypothetical protein
MGIAGIAVIAVIAGIGKAKPYHGFARIQRIYTDSPKGLSGQNGPRINAKRTNPMKLNLRGIAVIAGIGKAKPYHGFARIQRICTDSTDLHGFPKAFRSKLAANQRETHESNEIKPDPYSSA